MREKLEKFKSILDELTDLEEQVLWYNTMDKLQDIGDSVEDNIILINARLSVLYNELKDEL